MMLSRYTAIAIGLSALAGCGQDNAAEAQRALDTVGTASILCLGRDADGGYTRGLPRSECLDLRTTEDRRLHALVTQPDTGEVALVDLVEREAVDSEPTQPGFSFMPVGALPDVIVSSPGGAASFVTVHDPGREGIFALPSSCVGARPESAPLRDIRTWPACRLPVTPGPMLMLVDPRFDHDADATTPALVRASCDEGYVDPSELVGQSPGAQRSRCAADLDAEPDAGRRKLAVALPSLSEIWILDAQALLDRTPGSFDACEPERRVSLAAGVPDLTQEIPPDLVPSSPACSPVGFNHGPPRDRFQATPADFALDDALRLFVADSSAPIIHVLDASDPCALTPLPPLQPLSFSDPNAVITTRRLSVSPLTPLGKRYLYAIDDSTTETAGSLMAFDVSPGSLERTPIVRPRSPFNPGELPDRIGGSRNVADVEFIFQDNLDFPHREGQPRVSGFECNPDPDVPEDAPGAEYRSRARATSLRGTFAFAALQSGQISVIDVEDLDAPCRRPISVNPDPNQEDLFGCRGDDPTLAPTGFVAGLTRTVTDELSCNVVEPHRNRSRSAFTNELGARSAGILAFPTLTLEDGRAAATDQSDDGRDQPKMLGALHSADPFASEQLYVGPLIYATNDPGNHLELDPSLADRSSLLLSYNEPRVFFPNEEFIATYEGVVRPAALARFSVAPGATVGVVSEGQNASLCSAGVADMDQALVRATRLGVTSAEDRTGFARRHADYVQLMGELLEEADPYWRNEGASCGGELFQSDVAEVARQSGRRLCELFFGSPQVPSTSRDLRIVRASEDQLEVEPRSFASDSETRRRQLLEFVGCCFPEPVPFVVRAGHQWVIEGSQSGVQHRITADPETQRCVEDCSPARARLEGRAFEISCSEDCPLDERQAAAIGLARPGQDFACVVDDAAAGGIVPGEQGSECVFQNLTTRFAIYRGQRPSTRGMRFRWQMASGFTPLSISLLTNENTRSTPLDLQVIPELDLVMVTDGSARGVTFVSPRSLAPTLSIF